MPAVEPLQTDQLNYPAGRFSCDCSIEETRPYQHYKFKKHRIPSKIILAAMAERNNPVNLAMTEIVVLLMTFSDQTPNESTPAKTMIPTINAPILEQ